MVNRLRVAAIFGAAMFGASIAAHAVPVVLTFEGLGDQEPIDSY